MVDEIVTSLDPVPVPPPPTLAVPVGHHEELVQVRTGAWRLLLPLRFVERVLGAALPAARPDASGAAAPVIAIGSLLVPVIFADALLGSAEVRLGAADQMVLLSHGGRRALLWVAAVEEVVEFEPVAAPPGAQVWPLVAAYSLAGRPLAVLDVPRLLELAA